MQLCCDLHGQRKQRWQVRNSVSGRSKALTQRDGLEDKLRIGAPVCHAIERHAAAACRLGSVWTSDVDVFALGIRANTVLAHRFFLTVPCSFRSHQQRLLGGFLKGLWIHTTLR